MCVYSSVFKIVSRQSSKISDLGGTIRFWSTFWSRGPVDFLPKMYMLCGYSEYPSIPLSLADTECGLLEICVDLRQSLMHIVSN